MSPDDGIIQGHSPNLNALQLVDINQGPKSPEATIFLLSHETLLVYNRTPLQEKA